MARHQFIQAGSLVTIPVHEPTRHGLLIDPRGASEHARREVGTQHLHLQAGAEYVVVSQGPDGPDYTVRCDKHRWQSLPLVLLPEGDLSRCPLCVAHLEAMAGQRRYTEARRVAAA